MTPSTRFWVVTMLICGSTAITHAQDRTGFEAALRVGYAVPFGRVTGTGGDLRDGVAGQVPLVLELGARVMPELFVGVFGQYGFGILADQFSASCDVFGDASCSATDLRLGVEAHFHPMHDQQFDPWIGAGIGYEWLTLALGEPGLEVSTTLSGFEFFSLQGGLDIALTESLRFGPFASASFAAYSDMAAECAGPGPFTACEQLPAQGEDIASKSLHLWLMFGMRMTVAP